MLLLTEWNQLFFQVSFFSDDSPACRVPEHALALRIVTTKQYFYNTSSQGHLVLYMGYPLSISTSNVELPSNFVTSRSD